MKDFIKYNFKYLLGLGVVIVFIILFNRMINLQLENSKLLISNRDSIITHIQSFIKIKKDSIFYFEKKYFYYIKEKENEFQIVDSTNNRDSLIQLYWKHRSNISR